jgi:hypothetical protein
MKIDFVNFLYLCLPTWRSSQTYVDLLLIQPTRERRDMMIIMMEERFKAEKIQLRKFVDEVRRREKTSQDTGAFMKETNEWGIK